MVLSPNLVLKCIISNRNTFLKAFFFLIYLFTQSCVVPSTSAKMSIRQPFLGIYILFIFLKKFYPHSRTFFFHCFWREKKWEAERKRNINVRETSVGSLLIHTSNGDQTCNLGMCPAWKSNPRHFGL